MADALYESIRLELRRGWERPRAMHSSVSPLLWSLRSVDREQSYEAMRRGAYEALGTEPNCAGLEPKHLILSPRLKRYVKEM